VRYRALLSERATARTDARSSDALAKRQVSRAANAACHLLHREEGIDLRLPPVARAQALVEECRLPGSAVFKPPAVGSISMKIWS